MRCPAKQPQTAVSTAARWWLPRDDGRLECQLCPRACKLAEGQSGFCGTRVHLQDRLCLSAYGCTSGFAIDPIEKKPLYHFHPGSSALSFGTTGCNLDCQFCQNWRLSRTRFAGQPRIEAMPAVIAALAEKENCRSVAFTYNDPVVFAEYAIDTARACHDTNVKTVAVTAGYISPAARGDFFSAIDAANIDLKGFTDDFYQRLCHATLQPVLDTLEYVHKETPVWLEVTTLLIPGENDSRAELSRAADWFSAHLGPDVPWHFTAFHPAYRLTEKTSTPASILHLAQTLARERGIRHVYTGNILDPKGATTLCPACGAALIRRNGFQVLENQLSASARCPHCATLIPGHFD